MPIRSKITPENKPKGVLIDNIEVSDIVQYVKNIVNSAKSARNNHPCWGDFREAMIDCLDLYVGNHYKVYGSAGLLNHLALDGESKYYIENHIFNVITTMVGVWTANRPGFVWKPPVVNSQNIQSNLNLVNLADIITKAFDIHSQNMGIEEWYPDAIKNVLTYHGVLLQLQHDFSKDAIGEDKMRVLDPLSIFFDPLAKSWESAKYRGAVVVEEKSKFKAHWENVLRYLGKPAKIKLDNYKSLNRTEAKDWDLNFEYSNSELDDNVERGLTYYFEYNDMTRIPTKRTEERIDPNTGKLINIEVNDVDENGNALATQLKYPHGRLIVIFENDLVFDGDNEFNMFFYCPSKKVDGHLFGMGIPMIFYDHQRAINECCTQINMNSNNIANPFKMFCKEACGNDFVLTNIPNQIIGISADYYYQPKPPIEQLTYADNTGQAYNRYIELVKSMYQIAGIEEAVRGISKSGDSGLKVINLYENAINRFRPDITQSQTYILRPYAERLMQNMIKFKSRAIIPIGENHENSVQMVNIFDELQKLNANNITLQLKLIVGSATPDQRNLALQQVIAIKQLLPNDIPSDMVMLKSDIPDIVRIGIQMQELRETKLANQKMLMELIPAAAEMLPQLQEILATWQDAKDMESLKQGVELIAKAIAINNQNIQQPAATNAA